MSEMFPRAATSLLPTFSNRDIAAKYKFIHLEHKFGLVGILAHTPGGVKRSGLGAHACWVIIHVLKLA